MNSHPTNSKRPSDLYQLVKEFQAEFERLPQPSQPTDRPASAEPRRPVGLTGPVSAPAFQQRHFIGVPSI
jgi:hypothetical protein